MDDLFFEQIGKVKVKSAFASIVPPSRSIREKLALAKEEKEVVQLMRIRMQGDELFTFTINYLPREYGRRIKEEFLYKKPLLEILEQELKLRFMEAVETIEASFASQEVAQALAIPEGSPMLFVERIM
jgi:GntR family transcriptional regulator